MTSSAADDQFVREHEALVRSLANKLRAQLDLTCDLDDLVAFGFHGLLEARTRFDASRGVQFNTFAYYRIRGAMLDGVRKMAYLPRRAYAALKAAEALDDMAEGVAEVRVTSPEARSPESTVNQLDDTLSKVTASYVIAAVGQEAREHPDSPEDEVIAADQRAAISSALEVLEGRERTVIQGFYFDGRTLDEIARELGISKSWASRIHSKALAQLRDALES